MFKFLKSVIILSFLLFICPFKNISVLAQESFDSTYDTTDIFEINNYQDLLAFRGTVMNEEKQYDFSGKTVILNSDIDLQNLP